LTAIIHHVFTSDKTVVIFYFYSNSPFGFSLILTTILLIFVFEYGNSNSLYEAMYGTVYLRDIVYQELLRRGYKVTVEKNGDKEIDFVCHKRDEKLHIQVTYLLASEETVQREFGVYDTIRDNFPKYVVSLYEFDMSRNGIKHRNIRDFLLAEEWN
jgi:hypothetical protein